MRRGNAAAKPVKAGYESALSGRNIREIEPRAICHEVRFPRRRFTLHVVFPPPLSFLSLPAFKIK